MIGRFTMELLVVTRFPECGPLPAVILAGSVPAEKPGRLVGSSVSGVPLIRHWTPLFVALRNWPCLIVVSVNILTAAAPHE